MAARYKRLTLAPLFFIRKEHGVGVSLVEGHDLVDDLKIQLCVGLVKGAYSVLCHDKAGLKQA